MAGRPRFTEADLREAIAASSTFAETLRRLALRTAGGNHRALQKYVALWNISTDHFDPHAARVAKLRRSPIPLDEVLVESSRYSRGLLKQRLYTTGLKERRCELCGQGEEWRGRQMALILDHINGVATDNRLENLQIVCPNCAATLDTHCGKNVNINRLCAFCGASFRPRDAISGTARTRVAAGRKRAGEPRSPLAPSSGRRITSCCERSLRWATSLWAGRTGCPITRSGSGFGRTSVSSGWSRWVR